MVLMKEAGMEACEVEDRGCCRAVVGVGITEEAFGASPNAVEVVFDKGAERAGVSAFIPPEECFECIATAAPTETQAITTTAGMTKRRVAGTCMKIS